jgi:peptidoglycan/LPS O-acetylase OafA/YrhL
MWSLCVEEHYYLLFPAMLVAAWRFTRTIRGIAWTVAGCLVLSEAWRAWVIFGQHGSGWRTYGATDTNLDMLLWGSLIALVLNPAHGEGAWLRRTLPWWPVALTAYGVTAAYGQAPLFGWSRPIFQAGCILVLLHAITSGRAAWLWSNPALTWVGSVSYSAYLLHLVTLRALNGTAAPHNYTTAATAFAVALTASWAMRRLIEDPCRIRARRPSRNDVARSVDPVGAVRPEGLIDELIPPVKPRTELTSARPDRCRPELGI